MIRYVCHLMRARCECIFRDCTGHTGFEVSLRHPLSTRPTQVLVPFAAQVDKGGKPVISVKVKGEKKQLAPEEVSSMVLTKMKEVAEAYLGKEVRSQGCIPQRTHVLYCL